MNKQQQAHKERTASLALERQIDDELARKRKHYETLRKERLRAEKQAQREMFR